MRRPRLSSIASAARSSVAARRLDRGRVPGRKAVDRRRHRRNHDRFVAFGDQRRWWRRRSASAPISRGPAMATPSTSGTAWRSGGSAGAHFGEECFEARARRRIRPQPNCGAPARRDRGGQRNPGMAGAGRRRRSPPQGVRRMADDRHLGIGGRIDEGGVGAVLQQPPHQIGQQIAMAADRRVDAARCARGIAQQGLIERLAHAVQPLELVALDAAGRLDRRSRR